MFTLKAENLKADLGQVHFKQWNVKANSVLSVGSVIFTYEYQSEGKLKSEKYKSTLNGITVKEIFTFSSGHIINSESELLTYEKCSHPVMSKDMCAVCGEDLRIKENQKTKKNAPKNESFRMVSMDPSIRVDQSVAHDIAKKDLINLVKNRKLVLLADLDHTLIHTTHERVNPDIQDIHHYELQHNFWYHTKFRPGCQHFLQEMSKLYELHIVTFGERNYAHKIASLMDPERRFFHDRILSRNEIFNRISKSDNLRSLFPRGDLMVCIIDDREDVWNYARNLICVQPYVFFKNTGDINDPALFNAAKKRKIEESATSSEEIRENLDKQTDTVHEDTDDYLIHLENLLRKVHDEYYKIYESRLKKHKDPVNENLGIDESDLPDVKRVLPLIKAKVLEGCVITFSGVVPTGYDLRKQRCYLMATSLGAHVNENLILAEDESHLETKESKNAELEYSFDDNDSRSSCSGGTKSEESSDNQKTRKFTTHLVAAKYGTSKVYDVLRSKIPIKVVTPEWLINCNYKWIKCDEEMYKLNKDYEYKNCLFHHEYNMHQKFSNTNKNSKNLADKQTLETKIKRDKSDDQTEMSNKDLINEEMFSMMDKEVNEELSDSSSNFEESEEEKSGNELTDNESETSGPIDSDDSFDDKFAFDLERDLLNKSSQ